MRQSFLFTKTSKESTSDAASANADLLTRAGFIDKTMAGVYTFLPLGWRVLQKIEQIVREEMDKIGSEMFLTALSPKDNWETTGRLETIDVLFQAEGANAMSRKKNDATYVLNCTHEDMITPIVQKFCPSYQDLPKAMYQIQTKFRNETRPKSGILRGREFRMKDLYSFHTSEEDLLEYFHNKAAPAYEQVFQRLGLSAHTVRAWASGGDFSKQDSLEFQTKCATGEDLLFYDSKNDTYWNREIAPSIAPTWGDPNEEEREREDKVGKGIIGVDELAAFLEIEVERTTKTLLYKTDDGRVIAAAVRGGYDVNEIKLRKVVGCNSLALASVETVREVTGAEVGYAGPIGLPDSVEVYFDDSCKGRKNFECGANKTNEHSINCNFGRDVDEPKEFYDFKIAKEGDINPETGEPYETFVASEVGNLFTLYTKFTDAFGFTFKDKDGKDKPVYMGSYGIGTSRILGVLAEVFHDDDGLKWPKHVAPFTVHIVPIAKSEDDEAFTEAQKIYDDLTEKGVDCLLDDRLKDSVGSRLADADLIGIPTRIVVSPKTLKEGKVEVKERATGKVEMIPLENIPDSYSL